ncbi:MAG: FadR/GntR family transcriptional regulator [Desulfobacterales bacterium]
MQELLEPIRTESLKDVFIRRFEDIILSGKFPVGQKLPSERELALQLGVSRPVVHEGLVDLAAKGLVTMIPRVGTLVNDFRTEGSLSILTSLVNYHQGNLEPGLLDSLLEMRLLFEVETARLAALHRDREQLDSLSTLLQKEAMINHHDVEGICELDFDFHHLIALASGNHIYPLLLNSFRHCYANLAGQFFSDPTVVSVVFDFHKKMVKAIKDKDETSAVRIMEQMLNHGAENLKKADSS